MKTSDFDYPLPEELIASVPAKERDSSRLMVLDRPKGTIEHRQFSDISDYLQKSDILVLNDTKVIPARLLGKKAGSGGKVEALLLKEISAGLWECLVFPARRVKTGQELIFGRCRARVEAEPEAGKRLIRFECAGDFRDFLNEYGKLPLPPYINTRLSDEQKNDSALMGRYQTVYSEKEGATAAPTAGLHFTEKLLEQLKAKGVEIVYITLHTGLGTFKPVTSENVEDHKMHSEWYEITQDAAGILIGAYSNTPQQGSKKRRVIAVGTTVVRCLEDCFLKHGKITATKDEASIFIYPPYEFKAVDAMITNFHFPKSTLLMMVSAFAGRGLIRKAYEEAVGEKYRFFSFGDAMFIQ